jgi:hypothetical protein
LLFLLCSSLSTINRTLLRLTYLFPFVAFFVIFRSLSTHDRYLFTSIPDDFRLYFVFSLYTTYNKLGYFSPHRTRLKNTRFYRRLALIEAIRASIRFNSTIDFDNDFELRTDHRRTSYTRIRLRTSRTVEYYRILFSLVLFVVTIRLVLLSIVIGP